MPAAATSRREPTRAAVAGLAPSSGPFRSAHEALFFAFGDRTTFPRSIMLRMATIHSTLGRDRGLGGMDGAGIAGSIMRIIDTALSDTDAAIITAKFAVRSVPCTCDRLCCKGSRPNAGWLEAVLLLTEALPNPFPETRPNRLLREIAIRKYFGESVSLAEAAKRSRVHRDTASQHNSRIVKLLRDDERRAMYEIGAALMAAGLIEDEQI